MKDKWPNIRWFQQYDNGFELVVMLELGGGGGGSALVHTLCEQVSEVSVVIIWKKRYHKFISIVKKVINRFVYIFGIKSEAN